MNPNINYPKLIEVMENTIERQEKEIRRLEQENALLKVANKPVQVKTYTHSNIRQEKTLCSCLDWRDLEPSPFCPKCKGVGSY